MTERSHLDPKDVDREAVARVAQHVRIDGVRTVFFNAAINCEPSDLPEGWNKRAEIGFDCHLGKIGDDRSEFTVDGFFYASFWIDEPSGDEDDTETPPDVDVTVVYEVRYATRGEPGEVSDEDLEHFAVLNSTFNLWPYFREAVQSATLRMGIAPLLVPVRTVKPIPVSH